MQAGSDPITPAQRGLRGQFKASLYYLIIQKTARAVGDPASFNARQPMDAQSRWTCQCALEGSLLCIEILFQKTKVTIAKTKRSSRSQLRQEDCYK